MNIVPISQRGDCPCKHDCARIEHISCGGAVSHLAVSTLPDELVVNGVRYRKVQNYSYTTYDVSLQTFGESKIKTE